jgi:hypothetical protein
MSHWWGAVFAIDVVVSIHLIYVAHHKCNTNDAEHHDDNRENDV